MILVGMGFSHTQGCAIIKGAHRTKIKLPLASEELKKWYKKDFVSEEWITENYSWIGMLGKLLKADDLINFGFGGKGIQQSVRAVKNYTYQQPELSDHLFILQIPSLTRIEVLINDELETLMNFSLDEDKKEQAKFYLNEMHNQNFYNYKLLSDIYFLQKYIENLNGRFYCFGGFSPEFDKAEISDFQEGKNILDKFHKTLNFERELSRNVEVRNMFHELNLIENVVKKRGNTLHDYGLLDGDYHLSPQGNEMLAKEIQNWIVARNIQI